MTDSKIAAIMTPSGNVNVQSSLKKEKSSLKAKKPRNKPTHPRTADMVNAAIKALQERSGSSLQAIKKYMTSTYKIDAEKQAPFIKRYLKTAVAGGNLVQTKGKGAAGSFKLSVSKSETSKTKKRSTSLKSAPLKKTLSRPIARKPTLKKTVKKSVKKSPIKSPTRQQLTKGPAAKPPKAKTVVKVKVTARPVQKTQKKAGKTVKTKKQVKKTVASKKK